MPQPPPLPGLAPISTIFQIPDSPPVERPATSASEPSSPIPSRGRLRQRHKSKSSASLVEYTDRDISYWVPAGSIPTPGPPLPPRYTSQSEDEDSELEPVRRSTRFRDDGLSIRYPRAIQTGRGTETEDADDTSAVSREQPSFFL
jgi:hypothetical protein